MPLLGGLFLSIFTGLAAFFVQFVTRKIALGLAFVAFYATLTVAFIGFIKILAAALTAIFPANSYILMGFWMVIPTNFLPCVTALIAAYLAKAAYDYNKEATRWFSMGGSA